MKGGAPLAGRYFPFGEIHRIPECAAEARAHYYGIMLLLLNDAVAESKMDKTHRLAQACLAIASAYDEMEKEKAPKV